MSNANSDSDSDSAENSDSTENSDSAPVSKWKALITADDPRYLRFLKTNKVVISVALVISLCISVYVFVQVPLNSTITLHDRNSGKPWGLPVFAILIWPAAYVGFLIVAIRDKPTQIAYWEYTFGRWIAYLVQSAFMAGLIFGASSFSHSESCVVDRDSSGQLRGGVARLLGP